MLVATLQIAPDKKAAEEALERYVLGNGKGRYYSVARLYALANRPDPMFESLERARTETGNDEFYGVLPSDPFFVRYWHDPRFAALFKRAGLSAPDEPLPVANDNTATKL